MIDLVQHHEMLRFDDADRIFREDGAHAALEEARQGIAERTKLRHDTQIAQREALAGAGALP